MLLSRRCIFVLAASPLVVRGQAQRTPGALPRTDFSGRWRMDKELSDFHGFKIPSIVVRIVDDHQPTLNVHTIQTTGEKTNTSDATYFTDGSVTKNVINGREAESKCFWDGAALVIRTSMNNAQGEAEQISDRWELSEDKQTLTISSHVDTDKGGVDMKLVSKREKVGS